MIYSLSSVLALFALSTVFGLWQINSIGAGLKAIAENHIPLTEIITEIESLQLRQSVLFERALRLGEKMTSKTEDRHRFEETVKEHDNYASKVDEELKKGEGMVEDAVPAARIDEQRRSFVDIGARLKEIEQKHQDVGHHIGEVFKLLQAGQLSEAHALTATVEREEGQLTHALEIFLLDVEGLTKQVALEAEHAEEQAYLWMLVLTGFAFSAIPGALYTARNSGP
jgi:hypothetical protein